MFKFQPDSIESPIGDNNKQNPLKERKKEMNETLPVGPIKIRTYRHLKELLESFSEDMLSHQITINDVIPHALIVRKNEKGLITLTELKEPSGVYDFRVVCDESNNPPDVIDRNEFNAEILVKPARAIEFIKLPFA